MWRSKLLHLLACVSFNPHTHTGCDNRLLLPLYELQQFQSTHPYRVWQRTLNGTTSHSSFNPHTHTGCDWCIYSFRCYSFVSIHTPIQGVTIQTPLFLRSLWFQSTHPYRVWLVGSSLLPSVLQFQSTHPYRVWLTVTQRHQQLSSFNPHTHTGCDSWRTNIKNKLELFQSTHPYRVWLGFSSCLFPWFSFNPHTHTGCDAKDTETRQRYQVSIHTPIQGVTWSGKTMQPDVKFQSTHPYRVWL